MSQKQNYKFVLDRLLYPEYFKEHLEKPNPEQPTRSTKIRKSQEQKRVQNKLKNIIYNLERQAEEDRINNTRRGGEELMRNLRRESKETFRSFSLKHIPHKVYSQRFQTQIQIADLSQNTEKSQEEIVERLKKKYYQQHYQKQRKKKQQQILILPKLTLKSRRHAKDQSKKSFGSLSKSKKKYNIEKIEERERQLGRIVLQKVQKYFNMEKNPNKKYYDRVKSEEGIDQSFICYLKNKVMKANAALQK